MLVLLMEVLSLVSLVFTSYERKQREVKWMRKRIEVSLPSPTWTAQHHCFYYDILFQALKPCKRISDSFHITQLT